MKTRKQISADPEGILANIEGRDKNYFNKFQVKNNEDKIKLIKLWYKELFECLQSKDSLEFWTFDDRLEGYQVVRNGEVVRKKVSLIR